MSEYPLRLSWSGNSHESQVSHNREPCHVGGSYRKWARLITLTVPPPHPHPHPHTPRLLMIHRCIYFRYFCLLFPYFLYSRRVRLNYITQRGCFSGTGKEKRWKKKQKKQQLLPPELIWLHKTVDSGPKCGCLRRWRDLHLLPGAGFKG